MLRHFHCTLLQPCLENIYPGKTSLSKAKAILQEDVDVKIGEQSSYSLCWEINDIATGCLSFGPDRITNDDIVTLVDMYPNDLQLGDIFPILGNPITSELCLSPGPIVTAKLYFNGDITVVAENSSQPQQQRLDVGMKIQKISFVINDVPSYQPGIPWRGFTAQALVQGCGN